MEFSNCIALELDGRDTEATNLGGPDLDSDLITDITDKIFDSQPYQEAVRSKDL